MALGNWNEWGDKNFINLKLVAIPGPIEKKDDEPKFVKLDWDFKETEEKFTQVSWKLLKIKPTYTKITRWEVFGFKAFIEDNEEIYVVESTITNASKDMLNSLLTQIWGEYIKINVYLNKNKYPTACVKNASGEHVAQKFDFASLDTKALYDEVVSLYEFTDGNNEDINVEDVPF